MSEVRIPEPAENAKKSDAQPPRRKQSSEWSGDDGQPSASDDDGRAADATPWSGSSAPTGGVDCDRAADCCLKLVQVSGDPNLVKTCNMFRTAPSGSCSHLLSTFRQVVSQQGMSCP